MGTMGCGWWVRLRSVMCGGSVVCVCPDAAWAAPSQANLTLGASSHRGLTMGEPIDRCSMWPDQEDRCWGGLSVIWRSLHGFAWGYTQSGEPGCSAGCQLPPSVDHGGTYRWTLSPALPGVWQLGSEIPSYGEPIRRGISMPSV